MARQGTTGLLSKTRAVWGVLAAVLTVAASVSTIYYSYKDHASSLLPHVDVSDTSRRLSLQPNRRAVNLGADKYDHSPSVARETTTRVSEEQYRAALAAHDAPAIQRFTDSGKKLGSDFEPFVLTMFDPTIANAILSKPQRVDCPQGDASSEFYAGLKGAPLTFVRTLCRNYEVLSSLQRAIDSKKAELSQQETQRRTRQRLTASIEQCIQTLSSTESVESLIGRLHGQNNSGLNFIELDAVQYLRRAQTSDDWKGDKEEVNLAREYACGKKYGRGEPDSSLSSEEIDKEEQKLATLEKALRNVTDQH